MRVNHADAPPAGGASAWGAVRDRQIKAANRQLRGESSANGATTRLSTGPFDLLHLVPIDGQRFGDNLDEAEATAADHGQRFAGCIGEFTFQISLSHDKTFQSRTGTARSTAREGNNTEVTRRVRGEKEEGPT